MKHFRFGAGRRLDGSPPGAETSSGYLSDLRSAAGAKRQRLDACRKCEARLPFDRQRLQSKLTVGTANENIGADSYADRRRRIDAAILAGERVAPRSLDGGKHVPGENAPSVAPRSRPNLWILP
jgi:hypothetical protein